MIPPLVPGQIVGAFGPVASGKSHLIRQWAFSVERAVIFDTAADHVDEPNFEHIWASPRAFGHRFAAAAEQPQEWYRVAYHPRNVEEGFTHVVNIVWQLDLPRFLFVEEIHEVMSPHWEHPSMRVLNKYARKRDALGVIGSSQRIADVHKNFTSACRMVILFHTQESLDLAAIADRWGEEAMDMVSRLTPLIYDDATGVVRQIPEAVLIERGAAPQIIELSSNAVPEMRTDVPEQ